MENRLSDHVKLLRLLSERGFTEEEILLFTKVLNDEFDYGWRCAEYHHGLPSEREYGTGYVKP